MMFASSGTDIEFHFLLLFYLSRNYLQSQRLTVYTLLL